MPGPGGDVLEIPVTSPAAGATVRRESAGAAPTGPGRPAPPGSADAPTASTRGVLEPAAARAAFVLERHAPHPDLADRIERHWVTRWDLCGRPEHVQRVLPHPCVNLVAYDGIVRVHGVPAGVDARRLGGAGCAIGTKFRPGAFAAWSRVAPPALRGAVLTLEEALGPDGRRLEAEILAAVPDAAAVTDAVTAFLRARAPAADPAYVLLRAVVADMLARPPETRVGAIARDHGVSERTLQRLFRDLVGVGPKWVLRRHRLHEATERIAADPDADLAGLAHALGYADQAHLTGDFRAQVGVTPAAYARACRAGGG